MEETRLGLWRHVNRPPPRPALRNLVLPVHRPLRPLRALLPLPALLKLA